MPQTFPSEWRDAPCTLLVVPMPILPYVIGLLKMPEQKGFWASNDDYRAAYTAFYEMERCAVTICLADLIESSDRLYRMLDTAIFGTEYTVESTDPLVVSPAIEPVHSVSIINQDAILGRVDRLTQLLENAINGTETPLYTLSPSVKALLQSIIDALSSEDTDIGSLLTELEVIAGLLA